MAEENTKQRIKKLEWYMNEAKSQVFALYADFSHHSDKYGKDGLLGLREELKNLNLGLCDIVTEYMFLTDEEEPFIFKRYMELGKKLMDKINAELACREYFYVNPKPYKVEKLRPDNNNPANDRGKN